MEDLIREADVCLHSDPKQVGAMWNWSTVMKCMVKSVSNGGWHIQLNDDVVGLRGWIPNLNEVLDNSPSLITGLAWVGVARGTKAFEAGKAFAIGNHLAAGCAVAYHESLIMPLARFAHYAALTTYKHDDAAMTIWAKSVGLEPSLVSRSLFGLHDTASLMGHARYGTSVHTIETADGPLWESGYLIDNSMGKRSDEAAVLAKVKAAGWAG